MTAPVLELLAVEPEPGASSLAGPLNLRLDPGELAIMDVPDRGAARALVELCTGIAPPASGEVRFLGHGWAGLPRREAEALRGCIGLSPDDGGWMPYLSVEEGMLLARLHHGDDPEELEREVAELLPLFGLAEVPQGRPYAVPRFDLARAGAARAFLGRPALLLLESPQNQEVADMLLDPVLAALRPARARGAAALWTTRSRRAWEDPDFPATQRIPLRTREGAPA
jgi:phospholipid/cholesterol/gamma-HCH transport system ATP-binding protein